MSLRNAASPPLAVPPYARYEDENQRQHANADSHERACAVELRPVTTRLLVLFIYTVSDVLNGPQDE